MREEEGKNEGKEDHPPSPLSEKKEGRKEEGGRRGGEEGGEGIRK